ncbi:hypothetical protein PIB30_082310, partial [Stylosanthes scabra]|nr:hypothetical protein [Stylosanthes scabra]
MEMRIWIFGVNPNRSKPLSVAELLDVNVSREEVVLGPDLLEAAVDEPLVNGSDALPLLRVVSMS